MASSSGSSGGPKPLQGLAGIVWVVDGWSLSGWRKDDLTRLGRRPCSEHLNTECWASHTLQRNNLFVRNHPFFKSSASSSEGGGVFEDIASPDRDGGISGEGSGSGSGLASGAEEKDSGWGCCEEENDMVWGSEAESEDVEVFDFVKTRREQLKQRFAEDKLTEQDIEEIERYADRANSIYNGFDEFDVDPPKPLWSHADSSLYALPFDCRHPLYQKYNGRIFGYILCALFEYNRRMGQTLGWVETIWTNIRASFYDFHLYITFKAVDNLTGHYHDCRTEVYSPSYDDDCHRYSVEKFIRLPARGHFGAKRFETCDLAGVYSSIDTAEHFLWKMDMPHFHLQDFSSTKCRKEGDTLHVYLCFAARESLIGCDEIITFSVVDVVVKYYLASGTSKVVSFSRRSQEGENKRDKHCYLDLRDLGKLSLINKCAEAAVATYNEKMGADLYSPTVTRAYDFPALGENAYHIAFKATQISTGTVYICYARVIYDRDITWKRGDDATQEYLLESFIIHRDGWEVGDGRSGKSMGF